MQLIAPPKRTGKRGRQGRPQARGVALLFVLTTIAILTAVGVDFSYNSRVNLELAVQSRDALRARSLAMSAMNMGRVLLHFQRQVDEVSSQLGGMMTMILSLMPAPDPRIVEPIALQAGVDPRAAIAAIGATLTPTTTSTTGTTGATGATGATGTTGAATNPLSSLLGSLTGSGGTTGSGPILRLYCGLLGKFDSSTVIGFLKSFPTPEDKKELQPVAPGPDATGAVPIEASFGDFSGTFDLKMSDEDARFNVNRLDGLITSGGPMATAMQINQLIQNPNYQFLFNEPDHNNDKVSTKDTISSLKDWVDADDQQTGFDPTIIDGNPFLPGGGDENGPYSRYRPPYKAKNAHMDTVDEMRQVYGVNDNFMAAFGDKFTVYPDINGKVDVNSDSCGNANDTDALRSDILAVAANPFNPSLQNPALVQLVKTQIDLRRHYLSLIGISANDFLAIVQADGVAIRPDLLAANATTNFLSSTSTTFRITATGYAGRVKRTLTAVIRYDAGMGQVIYWHEE